MKMKKVLSLALCGVMLSTTAVSIVPTIFAKESGTETYNTSSGYGTKIENGSFEQPPIDSIYSQLNQNEVLDWSTTAYDNKIELLKENDGIYIPNVHMEPAVGDQAAELNGDETSTLYQYVKTSGGSQYKWNLFHHGRQGDDTMALVIGPKQEYDPKKTSKNGKDQFMKIVDWVKENRTIPRAGNSGTEFETNGLPTQVTVYSKPFDNNGGFENSTDNNFSFNESYIYSEQWEVWIIKSDNKGWHHYGDDDTLKTSDIYNIYNIPENSKESVFGFVAYATAQNNLTCGNLLDGIEFELYHPAKTQSNTGGSGSIEYTFEGTTTKTDFSAEQSVDTMVDDESTVKVTAIPDFAKDSSGHYKQDNGKYIQNNFLGAYVTYKGESHYIDKNDSRWKKVTKHNNELNQDYDTYEYSESGVSGRVIVDLYYSEIYTVTFLENGGKKYDATTKGTKKDVEVAEDSNNVVRFDSVTSGKYVSETCEWWNPKDTNGRFYGWELLDYKDANGKPVIFDRDTTITYTYSGSGSTDGLCFTIKDTKGHEVTTMKAVDGLTFLARWQQHVKIVPQIENSNGTYTDSNTGGTVSIEITDEVYDYKVNADGSFEYNSYMNREFNVTANAKSGYVFLGWYDEDGNLLTLSKNHKTQITNIGKTEYARFKYNSYNVRFHINDKDTVSTEGNALADVISDRIYSPSYVEGDKKLNSDNTISYFYDIPKTTKNGQQTYKVFKGWYLNKDNNDDSKPIVWGKTKFDIETDVYAHWIDRGTVAKDSSDTKQTGSSSYIGFDLFGVQLRSAENDPNYPDGTGSIPAYATKGLRFVTSLSEDLLKKINALDSQTTPSYGYVLAKTATANTYAKGDSNYELQYKDINVNGVNTKTSYNYVQNVDCTSKITNSASAITLDHFNASKYRIFSLVVTYDHPNQEYVITAIKQPVVARSYIRYTDANGLLRTYYNDYSGTSTYKGCSTSYSKVKDFIQDNYQKIDK